MLWAKVQLWARWNGAGCGKKWGAPSSCVSFRVMRNGTSQLWFHGICIWIRMNSCRSGSKYIRWYYMILYDIIWYYMILNDITWYYMILYDMLWYYVIFYDIIWYYVVLNDIIWYYMILYDIIWYCIIWYYMFFFMRLYDIILILFWYYFDIIGNYVILWVYSFSWNWGDLSGRTPAVRRS